MADTPIAFSPFPIQTCEARAANEPLHLLKPEFEESIEQFLVQDPFGLRKAIVPMFRADDQGLLQGLGTAFAADPWGTFLTADHVVDLMRTGRPETTSDQQMYRFSGDQTLLAVLGIGLIYGTIGIPQAALAHIRQTFAPAIEVEDPLAFSSGGVSHKALDLAVIECANRPNPDFVRNLPIRLGRPGPRVGDVVVAVGYPQINTVHGDADRISTLIQEGMFAGYGVVKALHPQGRDLANPTPVFEVAADWPLGMSGGPVFNIEGEVVGLVSRGLAPPKGEKLGTAWATWFEALPQMPTWIPTLDPLNPCHRRVWGVRQTSPWSLAGVTPSDEEATEILTRAGPGFEKVWGSWAIGTDDFIAD